MDKLHEMLTAASDFVWGPYLLIPLLLLTGPLPDAPAAGDPVPRALGLALYRARRSAGEGAEGDISHFQALMTALAATVGTGQHRRCRHRDCARRAGRALLDVDDRARRDGDEVLRGAPLGEVPHRRSSGEQAGGPMYYLRDGIRWRPLGATLGFLFASSPRSPPSGSATWCSRTRSPPRSSTPSASRRGSAVSRMAALARRRHPRRHQVDRRFTAFFVPIMIIVYMLGAGLIITLTGETSGCVRAHLQECIHAHRAVGGFVGATVRAGIRYGVARGIFSNESGLGSAGIAAAAAQTRSRRAGTGLDDADVHRHDRRLHFHRASRSSPPAPGRRRRRRRDDPARLPPTGSRETGAVGSSRSASRCSPLHDPRLELLRREEPRVPARAPDDHALPGPLRHRRLLGRGRRTSISSGRSRT